MKNCRTIISLQEELEGVSFRLKRPERFGTYLYKIGHKFLITDKLAYAGSKIWRIEDEIGKYYLVSEEFLNNHNVLDEIYKKWKED